MADFAKYKKISVTLSEGREPVLHHPHATEIDGPDSLCFAAQYMEDMKRDNQQTIKRISNPDVQAAFENFSETLNRLAYEINKNLIPAAQKAGAAIREFNEKAEFFRPIKVEGKVK